MTQTAHTPGPWVIGNACASQVFVPCGGALQNVCAPGRTDAERCANARLIAAAPDLLAACERAARHFTRHSTPEAQGVACDILDAIAKAR